MAKKRPPQSNSYDDADLKQLIGEIEELEAEKVSIRAEAAGKCGGVSKKIATAKGRAKDLGIPLSILNGAIKVRKLERQIEAVGDSIPDDLAEVWEDAAGQFSMFAPEGDDEPAETPAVAAAKQRKAKAEANQKAEQEEGAKVLDALTAVH